MRKQLRLLLSFLFVIIALTGFSRDFYWVGNSGDWNDASNWSKKSGGKGGLGVPSEKDDVFFDDKSFTSGNHQVTIHGSTYFNDITIDTEQALIFSGSGNLHIYGSLKFSRHITFQVNGSIHFKSDKKNNIIDFGGLQINSNLYFNGSGSWRLTDHLATYTDKNITLIKGELNTNDFHIYSGNIVTSGDEPKTFLINNSTVYLDQQWGLSEGIHNLRLIDNSSSIKDNRGAKKSIGSSNSRSHCETTTCNDNDITIEVCATSDYNGAHISCNGECDGEITITASSPGGGPYAYRLGSGTYTSNNVFSNLCSDNYLVTVRDSSQNIFGDFYEICSMDFDLSQPTALGFDVLGTQAPSCPDSCDGLAATSASGGTGNKTIFWVESGETTNSPSNLCAGTNNVIITDENGCTLNETVEITPPPAFDAGITVVDASCFGFCDGTIISEPSGSNGAPWTWDWGPGTYDNNGDADADSIYNLCQGNYEVLITDANDCPYTENITVTEPDPLQIDIVDVVDLICFEECEGEIAVEPSAGTPPYTYEWFESDGTPIGQTDSLAVNLCEGEYYVTVTDDNGCILDSDPVQITQPDPITFDIAGEDVLCFEDCNGSIEISNILGGTPGYSVTWFDDDDNPIGQTGSIASNLCAGDYYAEVEDANGCIETSPMVTINEPDEIEVTETITNEICYENCEGEIEIEVTGGTPNFTITWYDGNGVQIGQTGTTAINLCSGEYYAEIEDENGCELTTDVYEITEPDPLQINIDSENVTCEGFCDGSAEVIVTGGIPGYDIIWYDGNGDPIGQTGTTATNLCPGTYYAEVSDDNGCEETSNTVTITEPVEMEFDDIIVENVSCGGACDGSITVDVSGGTPTYNYEWFDENDVNIQSGGTSLTGLCPGEYYVVVTDDNGCQITLPNQEITEPDPLDLTTVDGETSCFGFCDGEVTANPTGGTGPYTYQWNDPSNQTTQTATGLCAGIYEVTIEDANGCVFGPVEAEVTEPTPLDLQIDVTDALCNGQCDGEAEVTVSGGNPGYEYQWLDEFGNDIVGETNSSVTGLCVGDYGVTVTDDNDCEETITFQIDEPTVLDVDDDFTPPTCNGECDGEIELTINGATPPYDVTWIENGVPIAGENDPIITGLCAGTYDYEVSDANNCTETGTVTLTEPDELDIDITTINATCGGNCDGEATANVDGGTEPYADFEWYDATTDTPIGQTSQTATNLCTGTYYVIVTDANGCTIQSEDITINESVVITGTVDIDNVSCFGLCDGSATVTPSGGDDPYSYEWTDLENGSVISTNETASGLCAQEYSVVITDANNCNSAPIIIEIEENDLLSVDKDSTNVTCFGACDGTATVTPQGGVDPYSILWGDGQTTETAINLCAGEITVTIEDNNGCSLDTLFNIEEPDEIILDETIQHISCNGANDGEITVDVDGGTDPLTFQWYDDNGNPIAGETNNSITDLAPGEYTFEVTDDNNCIVEETYLITEPDVLQIALINQVNNECFGDCDGIIEVNILGGTGPYTIDWSNGETTELITNLCADDYEILVTDANGCTEDLTVTITEPDEIILDASSTLTLCDGTCDGTATVNVVSGGVGTFSYSWDDPLNQTTQTAVDLCPGIYTATVTDDNNCTATIQEEVEDPEPLDVSVTVDDAVCNAQCDGSATVTVTGGTPGYNFSWVDPTGTVVSTAQNPNDLCEGEYELIVSDASNCADTSTVIVNAPSAITGTFDVTHTTCSACDGEIQANISGGTPNYTYTWTPAPGSGQGTDNPTDLCIGVYELVVEDDLGCTADFSVAVNNIDPEDVNFTITDATCDATCNGEVTATIIGGCSEPPCNFEWLDENGDPIGQNDNNVDESTATNLCAGDYFIQIINGLGCETLEPVTIDEPQVLTISSNTTDASCGGTCDGVVEITPNGGTAPYNYTWSSSGNNDPIETDLCAGDVTVTVIDFNGCTAEETYTINEPPILEIDNITTTDVDCNGLATGSATVFASGGSPDYSYEWIDCDTGLPISQTTQQATNLEAGEYSVTITDENGCSITSACIEITEPDELQATVNTTDILCFGECTGEAEVTVTGGTTAYSYDWFDSNGDPIAGATGNSVNNLCAGEYSVVVSDANGCSTGTLDFEITEPDEIVFTLSSTNPQCDAVCDGSITATVTGGILPYSYQWFDEDDNPVVAPGSGSNSVSQLCEGNYYLQVTDGNGCVINSPIEELEAPDAIEANLTLTHTTCNDDCDGMAEVNPTGGTSPYTVTWLPSGANGTSINGLCADDYTVVIEDINGCSTSEDFTITEPDEIDITYNTNNATCGDCDGSISLSVIGGNGGYSFQWDANANNQTTQTATNLCAGVYTVIVEDSEGCTEQVTVGLSDDGAEDLTTSAQDVTCFGECNGEVSVSYTCSEPACTQEWFEASTGNSIGTTDDITNLCAGDYLIEVVNNLGCVAVEQVTIDEPDEILANEIVTDATCAGDCDGEITVNPTGGTVTTDYNYSWSTSGNTTSTETNLCEGSVDLEITDDVGCTVAFTFEIEAPTGLTVNLTIDEPTCNGDCNGAIFSTVSGGTGNYTYQWFDAGGTPVGGNDPFLINQCAGIYELIVSDDNGCSETISNIDLTEPDEVDFDLAVQNILCNSECNGSAEVDNVTGGSGTYNFQWYENSTAIIGETADNINGLCAGDYGIAVNDDNGCTSGVVDFVITEPDALAADENITHISCNGECDGEIELTNVSGGTGTYTYNWTDTNTGNTVGSNTPVLDNVCAGTYEVTITDDNNCELIITDLEIIEPDGLTATFDVIPANCVIDDGEATVNVSGGTGGYQYSWNDPSNQTTQTATGLGAGIYIVTVEDDNGCEEQFSVEIENLNAPEISIDQITDVSCAGACDGSVEISVTEGEGPYTYQWIPTGQTSQNLTNACAGNYTIQVTDSENCTAFEDVTINAPDELEATFITENAACGICDGEAEIVVTGGTVPYTYNWTNGETSENASGLCSGIYQVEVTDANGCQDVFDVEINNIDGPDDATVSMTPASCANTCDGTAEVTPTGGTAPYDYYWPHSGETTNSVSSLCAGTYFMETIDANGCILVTQVDITAPPAFADSTVVTPTACGECDAALDAYISGGTGNIDYTWSTGATTQEISGLCEGIYTLTVEDENGCTETFTYTISGSDAPDVQLQATNANCFGECDGEGSSTVTGGTPGYDYQWFDADGNPIAGETNEDISGLCEGTYVIEVEDADGCFAYATMDIEQPSEIFFSTPFTQDILCNGDCNGVGTVIPSGGLLPYTYQWDANAGSQTTATATNLCAGTYDVTVTDANGCEETQSITITEPDEIIIDVTQVMDALCVSENDGAIDIDVTGGVSPYDFSWTGPNGFTDDNQNIDQLFPGNYNVTVTDANGCEAFETIPVDTSITLLAYAGEDTATCQFDTLVLYGQVIGAPASDWGWYDFDGNLITNEDSLLLTNEITGEVDYLFCVEDGQCNHCDTITVTVNELPFADAGEDRFRPEGSSITIGGNPTGPTGTDIIWIPGGILNDSTASNPSFTIGEEPITFEVTVINEFGCVATDTVMITPLPEIEFPNGFSPNGDAVNDVWEIDYIDEFPNATVEVYNRWGQLLFRSEGYDQPWDGTFENKPLPVGTYYYIIELNSEFYPDPYTGPITIMR